MKPIRFTKHALEQCVERGTNQAEVCKAIREGSVVITVYTFYF